MIFHRWSKPSCASSPWNDTELREEGSALITKDSLRSAPKAALEAPAITVFDCWCIEITAIFYPRSFQVPIRTIKLRSSSRRPNPNSLIVLNLLLFYSKDSLRSPSKSGICFSFSFWGAWRAQKKLRGKKKKEKDEEGRRSLNTKKVGSWGAKSVEIWTVDVVMIEWRLDLS